MWYLEVFLIILTKYVSGSTYSKQGLYFISWVTFTNRCVCHIVFMGLHAWCTLYMGHQLHVQGGTPWRSWLRHCATSRKVAGLIPIGVTGYFHWQSFRLHYGPGVDSVSNKWVPGMFPGGKGGRCVRLTTLPPSCADCLEIWEPQPSGTLRACPGM